MRPHDLIIVGAGPAGCSAAVQSLRLGLHPLLIDAKGSVGGLAANAFSMENFPAGDTPMNGPGFVSMLDAYLKRFDIPVDTNQLRALHRVNDLWHLDCDNGTMLARSVILATGTRAVALDIPGVPQSTGHRFSYEVRPLLAHKPETAIVIGGGEAAFDYALSLSNHGAEVNMFIRGTAPKACGHLRRMVEDMPGITIQYEHTPLSMSIHGNGLRVRFGRKGAEQVYDASCCVAAIGRRSTAKTYLEPQGITMTGDIHTSTPGLYVAGDIRRNTLGQAGIALGDGLAAAMEARSYLTHATSEDESC